MKKLFFLFLTFVTLTYANSDFTKEELAYIKKNTFKVGMLPDFPPFSIKEDGKQKGFSYDILQLFSQKYHISFEYQINSWPKILKDFKEKKIDIIDTISYKEKHLEFTNYTQPYYEIPLVIFSQKGHLNHYQQINDLRGTKLGLTKNIFYKESIEKLNLFEIVEYDSFAKKLKALALGEVDIIFGHLLSTQNNIIKSGYTNIQVLGELNLPEIKKTDLRFGITKENELLFSIMQKAYNNITHKEWEELHKKWITVYAKKSDLKTDNTIQLTTQEKQYIQQKKIIKVHNEKNWPPYNFNIDGQPKGFSIDYTNLLAQKLGLKVDYVSGYSWNEYLTMLKTKKIDVINNISKNKKREAYIDFTKVFHTAANAIYVKHGSENIDSLEKLNNKTIIMPKGFFAQQLIEKHYPNIKQILVKDSLEALRQLSLGKADATIGKKNVLDYIISTNNISGVTPTSFVDDSRLVSLIRMGVPKGEIHLRNILQKAQDAVTQEQLLNLKRKWFGVNTQLGSNNKLTKNEKLYLQTKHVINICTNHDLKPIEFINNNGKVEGIAMDTLNLIKKQLNIEYNHIQTSSLKESIQLLNEKKCDIIPSIESEQTKIGNASLTHPYLSYKLAIITQKGIPVIANIEEVIDKKVALKKESYITEELYSNYPNSKIIETNSNREALEKVNHNEAYFTLLPLPIATYYMSTYAMNNLYISRYTNFSYNIHMAINNDEPQLMTIFNKLLRQISEKDKREINNRWSSITIQEKFDYTLLWQLLLIVFIIILTLLYRQNILNKHNKALKLANKEIAQLTNNLESRVQEEIKKNEQRTNQLIYQSRLAQMGELINMIAHQWRQPLTAISATTNNLLLQTMLGKQTNKEELEKELLLIDDYSQHLSSTIEDFRNFYKKDKRKKQTTFEKIIEKALAITRFSLEHNNIEIEEVYNAQEVTITTYPTEINQVILNLLKNAEDILIEKKVENPKIKIHTFFDENDVHLEISDNGGGIKGISMQKVFEPYFSTKEKKDGTGLGLYMSKIIIEEHCNGSLDVENRDLGVTFTVSIAKDKEC